MTTAHDELFCRLAIRAGLLEKEDGVELLQTFRAAGKAPGRIAEYVIEEGWLDEGAVAKIENAISKRADGHVAETRRSVPKNARATKGGAARSRRRHHTPAQARTVKANPTQAAIIGIAMVTLVGATIFLVVRWIQSDARSASDIVNEASNKKNAPVEKTESVVGFKSEKSEKEDIQARFTKEDVDKYMKQLDTKKTYAYQAQADGGNYNALRYVKKSAEDMGSPKLPQVVLDEFAKLESEFSSLIEADYTQDWLPKLKEAKAKGEELAPLYGELEEACGPEFLAKAKAELE